MRRYKSDLEKLIDEQIKRFALCNFVAQLTFLLILSIPILIFKDYQFIFLFIWLFSSAYFLYWSTDVHKVDMIYSYFKKLKNKRICKNG